jgi:hypothetical protein
MMSKAEFTESETGLHLNPGTGNGEEDAAKADSAVLHRIYVHLCFRHITSAKPTEADGLHFSILLRQTR